ncbi:MAG: DCC1-like thiol-disulfide oxidoreductase family protein [Verrucomicrobia bacterium]|nr:DCC1-like thiol-disulfide oxidoreductase family protein [Verrucomicrobiota bacterium]
MKTVNNKPILFYDGECGLCHRFVLFVLKHEQEPLFQFAPLQGDTFKSHFSQEEVQNFPDSLVLITEEKKILTLSDAAVYTMRTLSPGWRRVGGFIGVFPRPIRDFGYRCVAAVRKKIFKKPDGACPLVPPELGKRFII